MVNSQNIIEAGRFEHSLLHSIVPWHVKNEYVAIFFAALGVGHFAQLVGLCW